MIVPVLVAAAVALAPAAAATPNSAGLQAIDLGTAGKLYAHADAGASLTGLVIVVSAGTARQTDGQNGLAALTAQSLLVGKVNGVTLAQQVAADGGSVDVVVGPDVTRLAIEALPDAMPAVAGDVARALAAPDFSAATVANARDSLGTSLEDGQRSPVSVGLEMLRDSYYTGGAAHPLLGTRESLAQLGPADVQAFYAAHYLRGDAFATATGVIDDATAAAARSILDALPPGNEAAATIPTRPMTAKRQIIAQRDIGVPFVVMGFPAPALDDDDFAAMLVLRAILSDVADRGDVSTAAPIERGLDVIYNYDVKPATFAVAVNGGVLDPNAGITIVDAIVRNATTRPFSADLIKRYKDTARGQWALEALSLNDRAWQIGAAVSEGAAPDTALTVAAAIDRVTPADVERVAKKYLQHYVIALVLPRTMH